MIDVVSFCVTHVLIMVALLHFFCYRAWCPWYWRVEEGSEAAGVRLVLIGCGCLEKEHLQNYATRTTYACMAETTEKEINRRECYLNII